MRIGIDFDNTIACYDGVFRAAAVETGLIGPDAAVAADRASLRDHLRSLGLDEAFTSLQGHVYGTRMDLAGLFPGLADVLARARAAGHELHVVSHRTPRPYAGPPHDLHAAAHRFLAAHGLVGASAPFSPDSIHFEAGAAAKIARIRSLRCDVFIDDLPEILAAEAFPPATRAILLDPAGHHPDGRWRGQTFETYRSWTAIGDAVLGPRTDGR